MLPFHLCGADKKFHEGWHGIPHRDVVLLHQVQPMIRIRLLSGRHHQRTTSTQHAKYVPHTEIETEGRKRQQAVRWPHLKLVHEMGIRVQGARMMTHHALRGASGARGVQQICHIIRCDLLPLRVITINGRAETFHVCHDIADRIRKNRQSTARLQQSRNTLLRHLGINGHVHTSSLESSQHCCHLFPSFLH